MFMSEKDILDVSLYNICNDNNYNDEVKKQKLELIANKYNVSINYLYKRYMWLKSMCIDPNLCHLDENHNLIYKIFDEYSKMLNENDVEHYYTSGILAYLLVNKKLERYHHDLDIFINMKDLEKLEKICNEYNFSFERKIGDRDDDTKRVMLKMYYCNRLDIPITVFMYVRGKDNSIIQKDYFIDENRREYVEYIYNSPLITELSFCDIPHFHNNIKYYSITLEALFLCKAGNRAKDIYDCNVFGNAVNRDKLQRLEDEFKYNLPNIVVEAKNDNFSDFIFKNQNKVKVLSKND